MYIKLCMHCGDTSVLMEDGGSFRVIIHVLPAIGLLPVGSFTVTSLKKWCQPINMQHFLILSIRTWKHFYIRNVHLFNFKPAISFECCFCYSSGNVDLFSQNFLTLMTFIMISNCTLISVIVRTLSASIINISVLDFRTQWSCDNVTGGDVSGGQRAKATRSCV